MEKVEEDVLTHAWPTQQCKEVRLGEAQVVLEQVLRNVGLRGSVSGPVRRCTHPECVCPWRATEERWQEFHPTSGISLGER